MKIFTIILALILGTLVTAWFFMLGVGNLGLAFSYADSIPTSILLTACFVGSTARFRYER